MAQPYEAAVIGGGIVGLATALALTERGCRSVVVLEAKIISPPIRRDTTAASSIPASITSPAPRNRSCAEGARRCIASAPTTAFTINCGKLVVASGERELGPGGTRTRGAANGQGDQASMHQGSGTTEPNVAGIAGLHVPETGVVD
jgi:L-2-hydroxyglutarate oxidase